jgi:hypothetical protein
LNPELQVFEGVVLRALTVTGRVFRESFRVLVGDDALRPDRQLHDGEIQLALYPLGIQPKLGPILVYERALTTALEPQEAFDEYFGSNRLSVGTRTQPRVVDVHDVVPMGDEEFWRLIDTLRGSASAASVRTLVAHLGRSTEHTVQAFWVALGTKLRALDHPANVSTTLYRGQEHISRDGSLYLRCRILAGGQSIYEKALAEPGANAGNRGSAGEAILAAAADAVEILSRDRVHLVGGPQFETGTNEEHWGPTPPSEAHATPLTRSEYIADLQRGIDVVYRGSTDVWDMAEYWRTFYGIRTFSRAARSYVERLVLFGAGLELPEEGDDRERRSAQEAHDFAASLVADAGETLVGEVELVKGAIGRSWHESFAIERLSDLTVDEYAARFVRV